MLRRAGTPTTTVSFGWAAPLARACAGAAQPRAGAAARYLDTTGDGQYDTVIALRRKSRPAIAEHAISLPPQEAPFSSNRTQTKLGRLQAKMQVVNA